MGRVGSIARRLHWASTMTPNKHTDNQKKQSSRPTEAPTPRNLENRNTLPDGGVGLRVAVPRTFCRRQLLDLILLVVGKPWGRRSARVLRPAKNSKKISHQRRMMSFQESAPKRRLYRELWDNLLVLSTEQSKVSSSCLSLLLCTPISAKLLILSSPSRVLTP